MAILNALLASSAIAIGLLAQAATPVNALAAPQHAARHAAPVSPNHNGVLRRKRNSHRNRKRCIAQQQATTSSAAPTDNYTPPADGNNSPAPSPTPNNPGNNVANTGNVCSSGGKIMLGFDWQWPINFMYNAVSSRVCFWYNWSSYNPGGTPGGVQFVPMLWGPEDYHVSDFENNVANSGTYYPYVMAFNEVNQAGQAQMDPYAGAAYWRQWVLPMRYKGSKLISPSTTNADSGMDWMTTWWNQLGDNEKPDYVAIHWYGNSFSDFVNYINKVTGLFPGYPIWITEFACTDWTGSNPCDPIAFAQQAVPYIYSNGAIAVASPFGFVPNMNGVQENDRLQNWDGSLTNLGVCFISESGQCNY